MTRRLKAKIAGSEQAFIARRRPVNPFPRETAAAAEAYCRQPAGTLNPGTGPRWDPWPYICSMSRPLFFFSLSLILLIDKGGVGLLYI
jgi:hypothetical protein